MNVAFDIDDTITRHPQFFSLLSHALLDGGHHVYIITLRFDRASTEADLHALGIRYTQLILATNDDLTGARLYRWKAEVCRKLQIDLFFEDMPEIVNYLAPSTIAFLPHDPKLGKLSYLARK